MAYNYGSEATVIAIINATAGDTNALRVPRALAQAEALIDQELAPYTTVPLDPAPQVIKDCANDWAAGIVRDEDTNPTSQNPPPNVFIQRAKEELCRYLATAFSAPCPFTEQIQGGGGGGEETVVARASKTVRVTPYKTDHIKETWDED